MGTTSDIDGSYIIFVLLMFLFVIIYLSIYYSKTLNEKLTKLKDSLAKWFFSLYQSKDGKTLITKTVL